MDIKQGINALVYPTNMIYTSMLVILLSSHAFGSITSSTFRMKERVGTIEDSRSNIFLCASQCQKSNDCRNFTTSVNGECEFNTEPNWTNTTVYVNEIKSSPGTQYAEVCTKDVVFSSANREEIWTFKMKESFPDSHGYINVTLRFNVCHKESVIQVDQCVTTNTKITAELCQDANGTFILPNSCSIQTPVPWKKIRDMKEYRFFAYDVNAQEAYDRCTALGYGLTRIANLQTIHKLQSQIPDDQDHCYMFEASANPSTAAPSYVVGSYFDKKGNSHNVMAISKQKQFTEITSCGFICDFLHDIRFKETMDGTYAKLSVKDYQLVYSIPHDHVRKMYLQKRIMVASQPTRLRICYNAVQV